MRMIELTKYSRLDLNFSDKRVLYWLFQLLEQAVPEHGILGNFSYSPNIGVNMRSKSLSDSDIVSWVVEEALVKRIHPKVDEIKTILA